MHWASRSTSEMPMSVAPDRRVGRELRVVWLAGLMSYRATWDLQRAIHAERRADRCPDTLLLLEHLPVITIGHNGKMSNLTAGLELLRERGVDLVRTDRGGDVTYHGPGQLVGYLIVDLKGLHGSVRRFAGDVEEGMIRAVGRWGISARHDRERTGVWVGDEKLASIGLRVSRWVTMHGFALNVATDLGAFDLIVPCGIEGCRITSMKRLVGTTVNLQEVGNAVAEELARLWGLSLPPAGKKGGKALG